MNRPTRALAPHLHRWLRPRRPLGVVWLDFFAVVVTLLVVLVMAGFDRVYRRATNPRLNVELRLEPLAGPASHGQPAGWRRIRCEFLNTGADTLWLERDGGTVGYLDCLVVDGVRHKTRPLGCGSCLRYVPVPPGGILAFPASLRDSPHAHTWLMGIRTNMRIRTLRYAAWTDTFTLGNTPRVVGLEWGNREFE